MSNKNFKEFF